MMNQADKYNLHRFIEAQDVVYPIVLKELVEGRKRSHWMWYIFPQLKGLGYSYNSEFYGISSLEEATAYLSDPILGQRHGHTKSRLQSPPSRPLPPRTYRYLYPGSLTPTRREL